MYDDKGILVPFDRVKEHFVELASFVKAEDNYPEALKGIDASPSRLIKPKFHCPYQPYLARRVDVYVYWKDLWSANRGTMLHAGIKDLPNKEMVIKGTFQGDGRMFTIGGVMDGYDPAKALVHEIKTVKDFEYELPKPEHRYQVTLYKFLGGLNRGMPVERARFYYVTSDDMRIVEIELDTFTKRDVESDIRWMELCRDEPMPGPRPEHVHWVCCFCDYWPFCKYSRGVFRKNRIREERIKRPPCREGGFPVSKAIALAEAPRRIADVTTRR